MPSEFDIIRQYFTSPVMSESRADVVLGIGDDAAILDVAKHHNEQLVQSVDTLVAGVHFPVDTSPEDIAYKALAVNLSDMAAMGAEPAWFTLAITLPNDDEAWLKAFSESLSAIAKKYDVQLIGGDTTHGPFCISITINGFVPIGKGLTRSKAQVTDRIYVSGTIGDAALALPQVELGLLLRDFATSCIDISDGLIADLEHITENSQVGAKIYFEKISLSKEFSLNLTDEALMIPLVLAGGDDYELCFTIPTAKQAEFEKIVTENKILVSCIGEIESEKSVRCLLNNKNIEIQGTGYKHFVD